ncbi:MAG TPA: cytochrome c3 family protein [Tepidisphaeraceae bacterium]|nr:cytochrome c3 family protein [Tepidisphaeraceae bacterium]
MARSRTTKTIAKRIDLGYFKRSHPMRRWRRVLTWLCGAIALVWLSMVSTRWTDKGLSLNDHIHNPGPVSVAHAMFQDDCAQCHTSKPGGGFILAVTDQACLKCHDGSLHEPNQKIAPEAALVSRTKSILAIAEPAHPGGARSADCVTCHIEHRGKEMLRAVNDAHCLVCHEDLPAATQNGQPTAANRITGFTAANHPTFGNHLRNADKKWVDPTVLRFNHQRHLELDQFKNKTDSCTSCHTPDPQDRRYMLPISYEKNCQSCHQLLPTPDSEPVVHGQLSIVRAQLMSPAVLFEPKLRAMSPQQREAKLVKQVRVGRRTESQQIAPEQWIADQVNALNKVASEWMDGEDAKKIPNFELIKAASTQPAEQNPTGPVAFVAYGMANSCFKCHDLKSNQSTLELSTLPTNLGNQRKFTASLFNHDSHRNQSCRDCHEAAWVSTATSDLLLPDINKPGAGAPSCVDCHHADVSPQIRGASASCVTCHNFHDRFLDRAVPAPLTKEPK